MSAAEFVKIWDESQSFQAVVERTGKTPGGVRSTANKLRRKGWRLKSLRGNHRDLTTPSTASMPQSPEPLLPSAEEEARSLYARLGELLRLTDHPQSG